MKLRYDKFELEDFELDTVVGGLGVDKEIQSIKHRMEVLVQSFNDSSVTTENCKEIGRDLKRLFERLEYLKEISETK